MDWSKAKNILIIAFIITNIFLIYHIEKDMINQDALEARSEGKIREVVNILKERNIEVEADVPMEVMAMAVLDVEYTTYDLDEVQKTFGEEFNVSLLMNDKVLHYERNTESSFELNITEKDALQEAEKFLKKYGYKDNAILWSSNLSGNQYDIVYKQSYKGRVLENSYMSLVVTDDGVMEFERMWLKPLNLGDSKIEIIPAPKALLKFMEDNEPTEEENITIAKMDLVYWLDVSQNNFTSWENVESGTAIPTWRIELASGEVTLIPAFDHY